MTLTAKDIAHKIAASESDADLASAFERVRHWTREGQLELAGERNPGTGRKRLYANKALTKALVLNELSHYGLGVGITLAPEFRKNINRATEYFEEFKGTGLVCFLVISKAGLRQKARVDILLREDAQFILEEEFSSAIVINLTRLFT